MVDKYLRWRGRLAGSWLLFLFNRTGEQRTSQMSWLTGSWHTFPHLVTAVQFYFKWGQEKAERRISSSLHWRAHSLLPRRRRLLSLFSYCSQTQTYCCSRRKNAFLTLWKPRPLSFIVKGKLKTKGLGSSSSRTGESNHVLSIIRKRKKIQSPEE
jgi:hypothetical protein